MLQNTLKERNDPSRTRRTDEVPFSSSPAATLHGKTQGFVLRLPPHNKAHATFMQPFQCDLQTQTQETHRTTYTGTSSVAKHIEGTKRPSRSRRTDEVPFIVACSHFTRKNTRFRAPASSPQQSPCNIHAAIPMRSAIPHHFPSSSPLPFLTTSHRHHFPSSPHRHHFPSSSLPIVSNSIASHFPSSSLPIAHHFPSSPLPIVTTSLPHHSPSSPLPFVTTSLPHHFPSSPLPAITTSLPHHSPSSPLPFVATSVTRKYCFPTSFD